MDIEQMKEDLGPGAVFDIGEENTAFAQYFTGECYLKMLTTEGVGIGNVSFAPKTVNHWHVHHKGGQILLVTGGRGWYQEWGKEVTADGLKRGQYSAWQRKYGQTKKQSSKINLEKGVDRLCVKISE